MKNGSAPKGAPQTADQTIRRNRSPRWAIYRYPRSLWPAWYVDPRPQPSKRHTKTHRRAA